jgi:hypothetical protein
VKGGPSLRFSNGTRDAPFDAFIAKVNVAGTSFDYAGYVGGSGDDQALGVAVDKDGNAYITGHTTSTEDSFPVKGGPSRTYSGQGADGWGDAFVAKVNPTGAGLVYAGYIGGANDDEARGIAVDSEGNAYVAGTTTSSQGTFPVKVGPQLTYGGGTGFGGRDGFVAKVNADGTGLVYAGYVGGAPTAGSANGRDELFGIAVNSAGNAYVVGQTISAEPNSPIPSLAGGTFPAFRGPQLSYEGGNYPDFLVAEIRSDGMGYVYLSYIGVPYPNHDIVTGGSRPFAVGSGIAVDGAGNAYFIGRATGSGTLRPDPFPAQPAGSDVTTFGSHGATEVMLGKLVTRDLITASVPDTVAPGAKITGTVTLDAPAPAQGELIHIVSGNRALATPDVDTLTIPAGKTSATFTITAGASTTSQNATITIKDDTFAVTKTVNVKP